MVVESSGMLMSLLFVGLELGPDLGLHVTAATARRKPTQYFNIYMQELNNRKSILCTSIRMSGPGEVEKLPVLRDVHNEDRKISV